MNRIIQTICFLLLFGTANAQHHHAFAPVEYVENLGQWEGDFLFKGHNPYADIYLRNSGFRIIQSDANNHKLLEDAHHGKVDGPYTLKYHCYDMNFVGSNPNAVKTKSKLQKHYYNYFLGKDPSKWKSKIHPALNVDYTDFYEHIDLHVYSQEGNVKYDLIVKPGGTPTSVKIHYAGVSGMKIDKKKLVISTTLGENTELAPYAYQFVNDTKIEVPCEYELTNGNEVSFRFPKGYNKNHTLFIDPVMVFARLTNSVADNWGFTATYDSLGNFYAGGITSGAGYIVTAVAPGPFDNTYNGGSTTDGGGFPCDVTISKYSPNGVTLEYGTYIGGLSNEQPHSIVSRPDGNLAIAGRTYSSDFPISTNSYDNTINGNSDMFVFVLSNDGTTNVGSTYIGGNAADGENITPIYTSLIGLKHNYGDDARSEIISDNNSNVYIAASTSSTNFPTVQPFQASNGGIQDGVIFQLNPTCTNLLWSTYLGGGGNDACYVLSFDKQNSNILYVAGGTESVGLPTTAGSISPAYNGGIDGFVFKIDVPSKTITRGTYIGTSSYDQVYGIQTDDSNHVYIMGQTTGTFPVIGGVYTNPNSSQFVSKMDNNLSSFIVSTVYGSGTNAFTNISPVAFLVDKCQNVYVSGWGGPTGGNPGNTNGMPITANALKSTTDGSDFYFIVFSKNLQNLLYATYYGQNNTTAGEHVDGGTSRFDPNGVIYQAVCAACTATTFPTSDPVLFPSTSSSQNCNLGCLKIDFQLQNPSAQASFTGDSVGCAPFPVTFNNTSTSATSYLWDFGNGITSNATSPTYTYTTAGNYTVKLIAFNPDGCTASSDTTTLTIVVKTDSVNASFTAVKVDTCGPFTAQFTNTSTYNNGAPPASSIFIWNFGDGTTYTGQTPSPNPHTYPSTGVYTVTLVMIDTNACKSPDSMQVVIDFSASFVKAQFIGPDTICIPETATFVDQSTNASAWGWNFGDGGTSTVSSPTYTYNTPGTYTVKLITTNPNTCNLVDSASKVISVYPSPVADFTWAPNPPTPNTPNEFTNLSTGATRYYWDFGDGTSSTLRDDVHIYEKDGTYNVCLTVWNDYGCQDTACRPVRGVVIPLVDVPTGFSPNGDGVNDVVYVKGYGIRNMTFRIFNRWGEKIFESKEKSKGWDGRYKGVMQEMEVYGYTLFVEFMDGTKTTKNGNITLLK